MTTASIIQGMGPQKWDKKSSKGWLFCESIYAAADPPAFLLIFFSFFFCLPWEHVIAGGWRDDVE
jgi:hypothetical protein